MLPKLDLTLHYIRKTIQLSTLLLCLSILQSSTGYIVNNDGHLVPFRIYKKGNHGARLMCFLHPMNCRGGFHKRVVQAFPKRQYADSGTEKRTTGDNSDRISYNTDYITDDDDMATFDNIAQTNNVQRVPDTDIFTQLDDSVEEDVYLRPLSKLSLVEDDVAGDSARSLSRQIPRQSHRPSHSPSHSSNHRSHGRLANPPPLDQLQIRAEIFQYPDYLSNMKSYNKNDADTYMTEADFDELIYKRRRR